MIKLALVINYIVHGGPSSVILNIIENLNRTEYDISLITLFEGNDDEIIQELKKSGIHIIKCSKMSRMGCILGNTQEFNLIVKSGDFDIIHTHGLIPDVISSRLHTNTKRISTIHNNMFEDYLDTYGKWRSKIWIAIHLTALKRLDKCICCSESVYNILINRVSGVMYVRNGIGRTKKSVKVTRGDLAIPENSRVFVYAGQLNYGKNIIWLINEFTKIHEENEYMLVLGCGDLEAECRTAADNHVLMLGFQSNPFAYFRIADIYISASRSEGFSISILEALDNGLGLLLSDIPSHREVIKLGQNIYLGELFTGYTLADAWNKLRRVTFDRHVIRNFKDNNLSAKHMTELYKNIYENIAIDTENKQ